MATNRFPSPARIGIRRNRIRVSRESNDLNVGISWCEVATSKQFEWYVQDDKTIVPVGAMIARDLKTQGAQSVVFINLMSRLVLVNEALTCVGRWNRDGLVVAPGYEDIRDMICCVNKTGWQIERAAQRDRAVPPSRKWHHQDAQGVAWRRRPIIRERS